MSQARLDSAVEVADGLPLFGYGHDRPLIDGDGLRLGGGAEALGVGQAHPLGPFEVHEVAQRPLTKGQQRDLHP